MEGERKNEMPRSTKVFDAKSEVSRIGMVPCVSRGKVENVEGDYTEHVQYLSLSVYLSLYLSEHRFSVNCRASSELTKH